MTRGDAGSRRGGARQATGRLGETLAARELAARGYTILGRNVRVSGLGEVDILAQEGDTLVIVEVRTRRGAPPFAPEDSVGPRKQARLAALAEAIAYERDWQGPLRVDVVAVEFDRAGRVRRLAILKDVVGA